VFGKDEFDFFLLKNSQNSLGLEFKEDCIFYALVHSNWKTQKGHR